MKITTRGRYAVMAMVSLAAASRGNPVPIQTIAKRESIPEPYLQQLFLRLRKRNIVKSVRGPGGGFILARDPAEITVGEETYRNLRATNRHLRELPTDPNELRVCHFSCTTRSMPFLRTYGKKGCLKMYVPVKSS